MSTGHMIAKMSTYLEDPFLAKLYDEIRTAGAYKTIQVDLTHACNLQCRGCYFFEAKLGRHRAPKAEETFDAFVERERARGTNFVTIVGGEPSLMLGRLKKLHDNFKGIVVTNGVRKIPYDGFENLAVAVSVWGDHQTDSALRSDGKRDLFAGALEHYKDDPRVVWYYTTTPGNAHEIESVVEQCVANGNDVTFNFYCDISELGGLLDHRLGFGDVRREVQRMIGRHPRHILITSYVVDVIIDGQLYGDRWGHEVCCTVSTNHPDNAQRLTNGKPYLKHFRAYNPDLESTRACCSGQQRDCTNCFDTSAHFPWIMMHPEEHMGSKQEFTNWLTTVYLYLLQNRALASFEEGVENVPEIHRRVNSGRNWLAAPDDTSAAELETIAFESL
jgi:hypothetical protein